MNAKRDLLTPVAAALFAAATAWPAAVSALIYLTASPYERALRGALCGSASATGAQFLGHCAACWEGAVALALAGTLLLFSRRPEAIRARR